MSQEIIDKLERQKAELEETLLSEETKMREFSQKVSESQITILDLRGQIKGLNKFLTSLKKDNAV